MSLRNCTPGLCTDVDAEFGIFENIPGRTGKYCQIWLVFSHADNSFNAKPFTVPLNLCVSALYSVLADLEIFFVSFIPAIKKNTPGISVNLNVS